MRPEARPDAQAWKCRQGKHDRYREAAVSNNFYSVKTMSEQNDNSFQNKDVFVFSEGSTHDSEATTEANEQYPAIPMDEEDEDEIEQILTENLVPDSDREMLTLHDEFQHPNKKEDLNELMRSILFASLMAGGVKLKEGLSVEEVDALIKDFSYSQMNLLSIGLILNKEKYSDQKNGKSKGQVLTEKNFEDMIILDEKGIRPNLKDPTLKALADKAIKGAENRERRERRENEDKKNRHADPEACRRAMTACNFLMFMIEEVSKELRQNPETGIPLYRIRNFYKENVCNGTGKLKEKFAVLQLDGHSEFNKDLIKHLTSRSTLKNAFTMEIFLKKLSCHEAENVEPAYGIYPLARPYTAEEIQNRYDELSQKKNNFYRRDDRAYSKKPAPSAQTQNKKKEPEPSQGHNLGSSERAPVFENAPQPKISEKRQSQTREMEVSEEESYNRGFRDLSPSSGSSSDEVEESDGEYSDDNDEVKEARKRNLEEKAKKKEERRALRLKRLNSTKEKGNQEQNEGPNSFVQYMTFGRGVDLSRAGAEVKEIVSESGKKDLPLEQEPQPLNKVSKGFPDDADLQPQPLSSNVMPNSGVLFHHQKDAQKRMNEISEEKRLDQEQSRRMEEQKEKEQRIQAKEFSVQDDFEYAKLLQREEEERMYRQPSRPNFSDLPPTTHRSTFGQERPPAAYRNDNVQPNYRAAPTYPTPIQPESIRYQSNHSQVPLQRHYEGSKFAGNKTTNYPPQSYQNNSYQPQNSSYQPQPVSSQATSSGQAGGFAWSRFLTPHSDVRKEQRTTNRVHAPQQPFHGGMSRNRETPEHGYQQPQLLSEDRNARDRVIDTVKDIQNKGCIPFLSELQSIFKHKDLEHFLETSGYFEKRRSGDRIAYFIFERMNGMRNFSN
ncbi:unnamed protein product [Caenorhabditis auriculariae]|uniref:Uncharacterized protein n=1 Tax=Caenorhabditis auriculariae TaxID=2777116 RepID=A0A8S1GNH5_9PELO|nr:unnamed protein product [Caenorhabditis auriculariae]